MRLTNSIRRDILDALDAQRSEALRKKQSAAEKAATDNVPALVLADLNEMFGLPVELEEAE